MGKLNAKQRTLLTGLFGKGVNFNKTERILYGHDIAAMPSLIKPLIGKMDNLMPHMIGDVVPLVTGPMINYLQGRN